MKNGQLRKHLLVLERPEIFFMLVGNYTRQELAEKTKEDS